MHATSTGANSTGVSGPGFGCTNSKHQVRHSRCRPSHRICDVVCCVGTAYDTWSAANGNSLRDMQCSSACEVLPDAGVSLVEETVLFTQAASVYTSTFP